MTKEQLRRYGLIKAEQRQLQARLDELENDLLSPRASRLTGMPRGGKGAGLEDLAIKHMELTGKYTAKLAELRAEQLAIEAAIEQLDGAERMLLRYRYLDGMTWEAVCVALAYSWRQTHRLHARALDKLRDKDPQII